MAYPTTVFKNQGNTENLGPKYASGLAGRVPRSGEVKASSEGEKVKDSGSLCKYPIPTQQSVHVSLHLPINHAWIPCVHRLSVAWACKEPFSWRHTVGAQLSPVALFWGGQVSFCHQDCPKRKTGDFSCIGIGQMGQSSL